MFNGNRGAIGTGFIDFYNNEKNLFLATYDGIFAYARLDNLERFKKIKQIENSIRPIKCYWWFEGNSTK